jgi:ABC-type uncharacterized transport system permease subunit
VHLPPLLASAHDWVLVLAWVIMLFYLFFTLAQKDLAVGVFALPVVILLVCSAYFLNHEPNTDFNTALARRHWGTLHASFLVFGMSAGAFGFLSGLMYLVQHRQLKTRHGEPAGLKMPSLARLAQVNRWSVMLAFLMLTMGFASGVYLAVAPPWGNTAVRLTDPAVVTSAIVWLILAGIFVRLLAERGPTGRHVAWLTICACGFLLLTMLGLQVITGNIHKYSNSMPAAAPAINSRG